ncbi:MAG TPA: hypothetical protein VFO92_03250 [Nitrososphaeraceae archaeon]|nr:hypothetical protein [Nitrososphaeraceae archaeon]
MDTTGQQHHFKVYTATLFKFSVLAYFRNAVDMSTPVKLACDRFDSTSIVPFRMQKERSELLKFVHIKFVPVKSA